MNGLCESQEVLHMGQKERDGRGGKGKNKCVAAFAASWMYVRRKPQSCILCSCESHFLLYIVPCVTFKAL